MSDTQYAELGDTIWFNFAANDTSGSGGDGASAAAHIMSMSAAASAAPVYSPTPELLSHASVPAGSYRVAVPLTTGNGFATGVTYAGYCTLAIDSQNPTGFIGRVAIGKLATLKDLGVPLKTTIATLASQTSFTLTSGSDQDDQYNDKIMAIVDADDSTRYEVVRPSNYTGSSRTVTLSSGTSSFTAAVGDTVLVYNVNHPATFASATNLATANSALTNIQGRLPTTLSSGGNMNVNVEEVNNVQVQGTGVEEVDEWRPA